MSFAGTALRCIVSISLKITMRYELTRLYCPLAIGVHLLAVPLCVFILILGAVDKLLAAMFELDDVVLVKKPLLMQVAQLCESDESSRSMFRNAMSKSKASEAKEVDLSQLLSC